MKIFDLFCQNNFGKLKIKNGECHRKIREGRPNFRGDIKLFIARPKQPLLELSPPVMFHWMESHFHDWIDYNGVAFSVKLLEQTTTKTELRLSSRVIQLFLFPPLSEKIQIFFNHPVAADKYFRLHPW